MLLQGINKLMYFHVALSSSLIGLQNVGTMRRTLPYFQSVLVIPAST